MNFAYILKNVYYRTLLCIINWKTKFSFSPDKNDSSHRALKAYEIGMGEITNTQKILAKNMKERDHLENRRIDEMTILKGILNT